MTPLEAGITLVIGGARSGKSRYVAELASRVAAPLLYVATAEALDREMRARIRHHRMERPRAWRTLEEPLELARRIEAEARRGSVVAVDCLTVWLGNLLTRQIAERGRPRVVEAKQALRLALAEMERLCTLPERRRFRLVVVSNEVGAGGVAAHPLGRLYRDVLGDVNQMVARRAESVMLLVGGIPLDVRALACAGRVGASREMSDPASNRHGRGRSDAGIRVRPWT